MIRDDVAYLFDLNDVPLYAFSENILWETEDLKTSTNQLILTVPMDEGRGITTEQDVYFRGRMYTISETDRSKNEREVTLVCDERQARLSTTNVPSFIIKDSTLTAAAQKALPERSGWKVAFAAEDSRTYNAELLNSSSMFCLRFLENQSGTRLMFDSARKEVSFIKGQQFVFDGVFRYGLNISNITKNETQPQATVLYPFGKDGMTIDTFNNGKKYIENFDWYISLGMTKEQARAKFTKESVWTDERYIYVGNLFRDAQTKLAGMAQPQINYKLDNPDPGLSNITLSTFVYVQDEEFDMKIKTEVGRIKRSKNPEEDEIELDYIPPSFGSSGSEFTGDTTNTGTETSYFQVKNKDVLTLGVTPIPVISTSITVFSPTAFEMGIAAMIEVTTGGLLEGYLLLDGARLPTEFKQTVTAGWHTVGLPFLTTGIQAGTRSLYLYMKMTTGAAKIAAERCEFYVKAQGVYGGMNNNSPDQSVSDDVVFNKSIMIIGDNAATKRMAPNENVIRDEVPLNSQPISINETINIVFK